MQHAAEAQPARIGSAAGRRPSRPAEDEVPRARLQQREARRELAQRRRAHKAVRCLKSLLHELLLAGLGSGAGLAARGGRGVAGGRDEAAQRHCKELCGPAAAARRPALQPARDRGGPPGVPQRDAPQHRSRAAQRASDKGVGDLHPRGHCQLACTPLFLLLTGRRRVEEAVQAQPELGRVALGVSVGAGEQRVPAAELQGAPPRQQRREGPQRLAERYVPRRVLLPVGAARQEERDAGGEGREWGRGGESERRVDEAQQVEQHRVAGEQPQRRAARARAAGRRPRTPRRRWRPGRSGTRAR